ncbi:hypothetical protein QCA50_014416 [Cerrena zonata]|uniref:Uncharacterized protein n=1 Tax=Cerrena zonata TaxID=2478898 RepID=A0AAW0FP55_9APHY
MSNSGFVDPNTSGVQRHPPSSPLQSRSGNLAGGPTPFRAPAHKHAHHLHSIPPREKSTRTLIIDHMLWVHARTRFAQARAELGMTDRTGGPSSSNYAHRERPENFEEGEEAYSDGEDITTLVARAGGPGHTHEEDDDERLDMQNLTLARSLRQRAESVEKVIAGMLDQPPEVPPLHPDDLTEPNTSPQLQPQQTAGRQHQHTLPNGVRLRLALGTAINDLFARRAPAPPQRAYHENRAGGPPPSLPAALVPLTSVSLAGSGGPSRPQRPTPTDYIRSLYAIGADPDAQNSPPSLRCPRHLHMGCEICVEAKVPPRPTSKTRGTSTRSGSTPTASPGDGHTAPTGNNVFGLGGGVTGWQEGGGIGSGLSRPGTNGTVLRRPSDAYRDPPTQQGPPRPAMASTKLTEFIIRFLRLSALVASELGREAIEDRASVDGGRDDDPSRSNSTRPPSSPLMSFRQPQQQQRQVSDINVYGHILRPSREWYFLLAGLLTRTVLEGYVTGGWLGVEPLEVLLTVGLGIGPQSGSNSAHSGQNSSASNAKSKHEDQFAQFDPDDMPDLDEAVRILFPSLRDVDYNQGGVGSRREGAEAEYEIEMTQRLARFYDVPPSTPDVATHMEDLAWQFPAEAVERAACRFCEAIARWRGKPELETYKKATWLTQSQKDKNSRSDAPMSIDSLLHSNPTSPNGYACHACGKPLTTVRVKQDDLRLKCTSSRPSHSCFADDAGRSLDPD